jgi:hypothetical protein
VTTPGALMNEDCCDVSLWHEVNFTTSGLASSDTFPSKTFGSPGSVLHITLNNVY